MKVKDFRNASLCVLLALFTAFNYKYPSSKRLVFLLVTTLLTFYLFNDIHSSIILSVVITMVYSLMCKCGNGNIVEGLENKKEEKKEDLENKEDNVEAQLDKLENDLFDNNVEKLENKKKEELIDGIGGNSDNYIDYNETMRENLKNLDMKNIEKMTNDTKDLMKTQKDLMNTMKNMAPLLKQGMGLVEMFKKTNLTK